MHTSLSSGTVLRDYLHGTWNVERLIEDRIVEGTAHFRGQAIFSPSAEGLEYRETGNLTLDGRRHEATQTYRWRFGTDGTATVSFTDGKPFHDVVIDGGKARAYHDCPPDEYSGTYHFSARDAWSLMWHVIGPRKDYTSRSTFTRLHRPAQSLLSGE